MESDGKSEPPQNFFWTSRQTLWICLILLAGAIISQMGAWGNPFPSPDQQYYLYGGGQILQGKIPYVDFWDRKPVGLFLLYAGIHAFGAWRFWALPLITSASLWLGSLGIFRISQSLKTGPLPAALAGLAYIFGSSFDDSNIDGQSESFFVPLVIWAFALILTRWDRLRASPWKLLTTGCASMGLFGIALEIKPSCVWEGIFLGCLLLWLVFQQRAPLKNRLIRLAACGSLWCVLALLPTLTIVRWYDLHGYLPDWLWANVFNYSHRRPWLKAHYYRHFLLRGAEALLFFLPVILYSLVAELRKEKRDPRRLPLILWALITLVTGILLRRAVPVLHYLIPALPPMLLLAACWWGRRWQRLFLLLPFVLFLTFNTKTNYWMSILSPTGREQRKDYRILADMFRQKPGCLFILEGGELVYDLQPQECHLTKFTFPGHLVNPQEQKAISINATREIAQILHQNPLYVELAAPKSVDVCAPNFLPWKGMRTGILTGLSTLCHSYQPAVIFSSRDGTEVLIYYRRSNLR